MRKRMMMGATALATFALGMTLAVLVAGSAVAKTSPKTPPKKASPAAPSTSTDAAPADKFSAVNGTVNAASDHEIVGSSAFPNYTTGAVDNYYTMAHAHIDNSPFAQGTASPFDTGPIGQTAAAGNFQQPQYADARWPGGPDKASYGNQGGPDANAVADNDRATADASESSNGFSGPGAHGTKTLALPTGFDSRLRQALSAWDTKWGGRIGMKSPSAPKPVRPGVPATVPSSPVTPPSLPITTPHSPVGGVTVPSPTLPGSGGKAATTTPVSLTVPRPPALPGSKAAPTLGGTESDLASSTLATLVYKTDGGKPDTSATNTCKTATVATTGATTTTEKPRSGTCTLVLKGESSIGRVTIGGSLIVIDGIHVTASITNDGAKPRYEAAVSVASASIAGIPVTIDEKGVHVAGQGGGLPYQQASSALNTALNKAGIQIFLVQPEVTDCSASGSSSGSGTTGTTTTTTSTNPSGGTSACGGQTGMSAANTSCAQSSGSGSSGGPGLPAPPTPTPTPTPSSTTTTSSCAPPPPSCDQSGTATGTGTTKTTTTSAAPSLQPGPSTTTSSTTTTPSSSCDQSSMSTPPSSCAKTGTGTGTTSASSNQSTTASTDAASPASNGTFQFGPGPGTNNAGEMTVTATGVHIVFTQPVSPPGVPAQFAEHILGEVFVDSLATPMGPSTGLGFGFGGTSSASSPSSSCLGGKHSGFGSKSGGSLSSGGSGSSGSASSGSASSGSLGASGSGSSYGSSSQGGSSPSAIGSSTPVSFASKARKPLWLLLAYLVWQGLVVGTGWSVWKWRRGGTT